MNWEFYAKQSATLVDKRTYRFNVNKSNHRNDPITNRGIQYG